MRMLDKLKQRMGNELHREGGLISTEADVDRNLFEDLNEALNKQPIPTQSKPSTESILINNYDSVSNQINFLADLEHNMQEEIDRLSAILHEAKVSKQGLEMAQTYMSSHIKQQSDTKQDALEVAIEEGLKNGYGQR